MIIAARHFFADIQSLNAFLALVAAVAVSAHIFPVYLKFKGGKGVATSLAALLAFNPITGLIGCLSWIIVFAYTKTSAIASMASILIATGFTFYSHGPLEERLLTIFLEILIILRHKENIARILSDEEHKFTK